MHMRDNQANFQESISSQPFLSSIKHLIGTSLYFLCVTKRLIYFSNLTQVTELLDCIAISKHSSVANENGIKGYIFQTYFHLLHIVTFWICLVLK